MKKVLTVLFIALSFTLSFGQSGGDGSSGNPWQISNYADLQWLQSASTSGVYFVQTANIDASSTSVDGWSPFDFSGYYDGAGYAIDQLTFSNGGGRTAFIATMSSGEVKNLGLTNVSITKTGGDYGAALVAYFPGGTVDNCYSTGNIIYNTSGTTYNFGGLIGRSNSASATVSNSYSEVNISYLNAAPVNVGGLVGYNSGSTITNCYATGNVQGSAAVGGLVGENLNGGVITKSYSTGNATASSSGVGGFLGINNTSGTVSECYSKGDVDGGYKSGGFVGYNYANGAVISNCYSFGELTTSNAGGGAGFCGVNNAGIIEYCYSTGVSNSKGFAANVYGTGVAVTDCFFDATTSGATDSYATGETTANMKKQATFTNWDFTAGTGEWEIVGGDDANYPRLQNQQDPALPVELTSFTATASGDAVVLNWETATEVNNYGFNVESSSDNSNWNNIGFVAGHGNSNSPNSYSYTAVDGANYYRLKQVDTDGAFEYSSVVEVEGNLSYKLNQNHPNPFNPSTVISFTVPEASKVSITVFNALGQKVVELANREFAVGNHTVDFNASNLTSGIYFYTLKTDGFSKTMKMMLLK